MAQQRFIAETKMQNNEGILKKSIKMAMREYFENSAIAGFSYLVKPRRHKFERLMWFIVISMATTLSIFVVLRTWNEFTKTPTIVSLETPQFPTKNVAFPAIALCNINKLSKKRVLEYAKILSVKLKKPVDYLMNEQLYYLGRHIDHDIEGFEDYLRLMDLIVAVDYNKTTGLFDTQKKMKMLAPTCDEMLVRCRWSDIIVDCNKIFRTRLTAEGYCCTFNYQKSIDQQDESEEYIKDNLRLSKIGLGSGLSIIANPHLDDYYYTIRSTQGFSILIFDPHDYPDVSTGNLVERVASINQENFLDIKPTMIYSVPDVKRFSIRQRKCMFKDDNKKDYHGYYSYSNCIVECKMKSVLTLCKCMPFFLPNSSATQFCNLAHIPCLHKYKTKFRTILTGDFIDNRDEGLEEEHEDGLVCPECYPDCSITSYQVHFSSTGLAEKNDHTDLYQGLDIANLSIIHLYYSSSSMNLYKQDVMYYWFEIVSLFGGIGGLFLGFSIISVVEIVYYCTLRFYSILRSNGFKIFGRF